MEVPTHPGPCSLDGVAVFVGRDRKIVDLLKMADRIADTTSPVFIYGESGTGKEQLARYIHCHSSRRKRTFVKIDCATIPKDLIESELFGYERGAFSGAVETKPGKLERGDGGTILLDNITSLELNTQAKLTRVIQERCFERLGGGFNIKIDTRFITCSVLNPNIAIARGLLRKDLYYRLGVICLEVPPLRDRQGDIPILVDYFLRQLQTAANRPLPIIEPSAMDYLTRYHWPGNIRQLMNVLERSLITCENNVITQGSIQINYINLQDETLSSALHHEVTLEELEKTYIEAILVKSKGNKSRAAKILGINRKTLLEKRKKYGLL